MTTIERIFEQFPEEDFLLADGFNDAVIGVIPNTMQIVYDTDRVIDILIAEGMDEEDALEHFSYNIEGAYVGEKTPLFMIK